MSAPKSVVKINKSGIQYTSSVDKAEYYLYELCRAALRDTGRLVSRKFKEAYLNSIGKMTGNASRSIKYKVISGKSTQYPRVQVGIKGGKGFYSMYQEFGSSKTPRLGLLSKSVEDNIADIVKIQSQYLSGLEDEATALALINEADMEGDADN